MFVVLHSDINSLESGLLHLTGHPYCIKGRSAKVKDGIRNSIIRNYLVDRYKHRLKPYIHYINRNFITSVKFYNAGQQYELHIRMCKCNFIFQ